MYRFIEARGDALKLDDEGSEGVDGGEGIDCVVECEESDDNQQHNDIVSTLGTKTFDSPLPPRRSSAIQRSGKSQAELAQLSSSLKAGSPVMLSTTAQKCNRLDQLLEQSETDASNTLDLAKIVILVEERVSAREVQYRQERAEAEERREEQRHQDRLERERDQERRDREREGRENKRNLFTHAMLAKLLGKEL